MNPRISLGTWFEAFDAVVDSFEALPLKSLPVSAASGHVVADDIQALCSLPAYDTSAMDGWAVSGQGPWQMVGEVATGQSSHIVLSDGQCLKISTGGVVPQGCTAVLPWEDATVTDSEVTGSIDAGSNIRPSATESVAGDVLIERGHRLIPTHLGLLAATGHDTVEVIARPRIAVLLLGDELMHAGVPHDGMIRDSLGVQLPAFLDACGAELVSLEFLPDDEEHIIAAFSRAFEAADFVISTGGTADGPKDFTKFIIEHFSMDFIVDRVRMRPGYHFLLAAKSHAGRKIPYIALPGNPQSALASLTSFGIALIDRLSGAEPQKPKQVAIAHKQTTPPGFARLIHGNVVDGEFVAGDYLGSAMLRGLAASQGFALVGPGDVEAGQLAYWLPLPFSPRRA